MLTLTLAFLADLAIGDPVYAYHPVRLMGHAIQRGEDYFRRLIPNAKLAGASLALLLPIFVFLFTWSVLLILGKIHFFLGWLVNCFWIYSSISVHDLHQEGMQVYKDLKDNDLWKARNHLSRIVGRETENLSDQEIVRASVETIAESTMDGIVAPLFYAALGGAPLALAYKAVNTLDSMIGYRSGRYRDFGYIAAKQDELANWVPARLSYGVIVLASLFATWRFKSAWLTGWRDGIVRSFGNSAIPEATFAGALALQLGGENTYEGRMVEKPFLGLPIRPLEPQIIVESLRLMYVSAWISFLVSLLLHRVITM